MADSAPVDGSQRQPGDPGPVDTKGRLESGMADRASVDRPEDMADGHVVLAHVAAHRRARARAAHAAYPDVECASAGQRPRVLRKVDPTAEIPVNQRGGRTASEPAGRMPAL